MTWTSTDTQISYVYEGRTAFQDSIDHWGNAFRRLLRLDEERARQFVEAAIRTAGGALFDLPDARVLDALRAGARAVYGEAAPATALAAGLARLASPYGDQADTIFADAIGPNTGACMVGDAALQLAWLVDAKTLQPFAPENTDYEETYFDGGVAGIGYGAYLEQQAWRLEKGRRFVRQMDGILHYMNRSPADQLRLLDVGSGFGFFRKAADEAGWHHEGWEISKYAAHMCKNLFGFETPIGPVDDIGFPDGRRFDVLTMWDVIEHVPDPHLTMRKVGELLTPGGTVFIRTPNLIAWECQVFGANYHSFKLEHVFIFGPVSICRLLEQAGFEVGFLTTETHLFRGFLGARVEGVARRLLGSDILVAASKPR